MSGLRVEGSSDSPDVFLREAIEQKIADLGRRIEHELAKGLDGDGEEIARLTAARAKFSEILRSPRIYLVGDPRGEGGGRAEPLRPILPVRGDSGAAAAMPGTPPARGPAGPRPAGMGQMRAFLESLRTGAGSEAAPVDHRSAPASAPEPERRAAGRPAARPPVAPARAQDRPAARAASAAEQGEGPKTDAVSIRRDVVESLKRRAASQGFKDVQDLLTYKRDQLRESLKGLVASRADADLVRNLRKDLREIETLLEADIESAVRGIEEFDEVAGVDKGGLAALRKEMAGLMREIR